MVSELLPSNNSCTCFPKVFQNQKLSHLPCPKRPVRIRIRIWFWFWGNMTTTTQTFWHFRCMQSAFSAHQMENICSQQHFSPCQDHLATEWSFDFHRGCWHRGNIPETVEELWHDSQSLICSCVFVWKVVKFLTGPHVGRGFFSNWETDGEKS